MSKIKWCKNQKTGIELVDINENLSKEYMNKSESALKAMKSLNDNKEWQISSAYYCMYFSLYAILIRSGVKCEIHSCTIEFAKEFLKDHLSDYDIVLLSRSMTARIDVQYYTDRAVSDIQYNEMLKEAPNFNLKCREILNNISEEDIEDIRVALK